jgi:hypothetical protein
MKYKLVYDSDYEQFIGKVNSALADGWTLQGGVAVRTQGDHWVYYQALVTWEDANEPERA